ncbi:unnamed protein product, partial [Ectocarpus sp. 12 AP-2014]
HLSRVPREQVSDDASQGTTTATTTTTTVEQTSETGFVNPLPTVWKSRRIDMAQALGWLENDLEKPQHVYFRKKHGARCESGQMSDVYVPSSMASIAPPPTRFSR